MRAPIEWINEFVSGAVTADRLSTVLTMGGLEVERVEKTPAGDVIEIGVTPNRGDCLSIIGVAREAAAMTGLKLKVSAPKKIKTQGRIGDIAKVSIRDKKACPRYGARVVRGVKVCPSPERIAKRLAACGIRPINSVVDATNLVMLETGHPIHAFDLRELQGSSVVVRRAGTAQKFTTLDGVERDILPEDILICDASRPVALAGVMGGANSEVKDDTTDILLECAYFDPASIRKTSRRLGLSSESSRRFERGVDPNAIPFVLERLVEVICELAGGIPAGGTLDVYPAKLQPKKIMLPAAEVKRTLGISITPLETSKILSKLGIQCTASKAGVTAIVPTFRPDIQGCADLIEEVARLYGYEKITEEMPVVRMNPVSRREHLLEEFIARSALVSCGFNETLLYGFTSEECIKPFDYRGCKCIKVDNPLSVDESVMRTSLLPGLLDAMKLNVSKQRKDLKLFSLQNVFKNCQDLTQSQCRRVAGVLCGRRSPDQWERSAEKVDFYDAKGAVEVLLAQMGIEAEAKFSASSDIAFMHPSKTASVLISGKDAGFVGQLHPEVTAKWDADFDVFCFELDFAAAASASRTRAPRFKEISKFPIVERDIAIVLPVDISSDEIVAAIGAFAPKFLTNTSVFDVYSGKGIDSGKKSVAITLTFGLSDRTLTDEEVNAAQGAIVASLSQKFGATLRG